MKTAMRTLACVAAAMCGATVSLVTGAAGNDAPDVATGEVVAMHDVPGAQDLATAASGDARNVERSARELPPAMTAVPSEAESRVEQPQVAHTPDDPRWPSRTTTIALSEDRLDAMRGGFDMPSGLKVSFGISRVAYVNGNLVTTTSVNIPDVSAITAQQAQALIAANAGALVQVGHGNVVQAGALPALTGSVLQNSLSNQQIQAMTTIDTSVNSLSLFKGMNVMSTLTGALASAVHPH
ncbi:hypothetical protein [Paraburkholderia flava]|uniref:hypothetical protein n=1 Tax=Paraburkholderia flava TaxID=2547393 RepID=UPI00105B77B4|nr:hypothetical protein [Paraburkholderia flava]